MKKYEFEKALETNKFDMSVVNARRFAKEARTALQNLEEDARCYHLKNEDYYLDIKEFLDTMLSRLEATPDQEERIIDGTGAELLPGDPERCQGNGEHPGFECWCDNCDHFLGCFPNWKEELQND